MKLLSLAILCCILASVAFCSQCPPGKYKSSSLIIPCKNCQPGSYCPGDDQSHKCTKGTISQAVATQCTSCPSGRSNDASTYCLLPSTPTNAIEIYPDRPFKVAPTSNHVFLTIESPMTTFVTFSGKDVNGLVVYASNQTALPSSSNSLYHAIGVNATIISFVSNGILYFSLESKNSSTIEFIPKVSYINYRRIDTDGNTLNLQHATFENSIVAFHDNTYIPIGSNVRIRFKLSAKLPQDCYLYFSNNPNVVIPTPDNADVILRVKQNLEYQLDFTQPRNGPFIISLYSPQPIRDVDIYLFVLFW